jgi:hypothetical protein
MSKTIRSKVRKIIANRRRFRRLKVAREAKLIVGLLSGEGARREHMIGQTCDISDEGMAILLPVISPKQRALLTVGTRARVVVALPLKTLQMDVTVVRSEFLDARDAGAGQAIAIEINRILGDNKAAYKEYLDSLQ